MSKLIRLGGLAFLLVLGCETVDDTEYDGSDDSGLEERAAAPSTGHTSNNLVPKGQLTSNQYLKSSNSQYRLYLQGDGNVVLRRMSDKKALWATGTNGKSATRLSFQGDGNLVLRTAAGAAVWSSKTAAKNATLLRLNDDGSLVIYKGTSVIWSVNGGGSSDDLCPFDPSKTAPGQCGCGVPDTDTDKDGTADCKDGCANDPNKTVPGQCGCGKSEASCSSSNTWKFVVVGDSRGSNNGVNTDAWGHLVQAIVKEGAEFVLFPGDLTTNGTQTQLAQWLKTTKPLYDAKIGVYPLRGNHEGSVSAWNSAFTGSYRLPQNGPTNEKNLTYSAVHKNVFFVALDNYSSSYEVNQSWLSTQLAANSQPHVFVFGHEPAFAADHSDTLDDHSSQRNTFWQSLKAAGCRTYFAGHDHFYDHARIDDGNGNSNDDLHQFIVGSAGAPLYGFSGKYSGANGGYTPKQQYHADQYGYVVVQITGMSVKLTFKQRSGSSYIAKDTLNYSVQ